MRALEVSSILDCADMAAHASLYRTESRWGLYHNRVDHPDKDDDNWFCHTLVEKVDGRMVSRRQPIQPYVVPVEDAERTAYDRLRVSSKA